MLTYMRLQNHSFLWTSETMNLRSEGGDDEMDTEKGKEEKQTKKNQTGQTKWDQHEGTQIYI